MIWLLALCVFASQAIKIIRFYFFIIDRKVCFRKFVALYSLTSIVNIIIPFKIGELFRIAAFGFFLKNIQATLLAIITERFFDSIIILPFFLISAIKFQSVYPFMIFALATLILISYSLYMATPSLVFNLNLYLMLKKNSRLDKNILKILDYMEKLHSIEGEILKTKKRSIIFFTAFAWMFDLSAMSIAVQETGKSVGVKTISEFIYKITSFNNISLLSVYVIVSLSVFGIVSLITGIIILKTGKKANNYE